MYGRTANARSAARATDTATVNLRRRMALAVARRFGGAGQPVTQPTALASSSGLIAASVDSRQEQEPDNNLLALDQRVRETGEW
ncbi:hypothetical protein ACSFA3_18150 [Variovorax sp. RHLX14]|uniref:hypothetical protein n=1 Tax=Variovorax sp. RHLX14 TaxID=1259731 RepID=UPI003F44BE5E